MKRLIILLAFSWLPFRSLACEICGLFMGVMAYDTRSSLSIYHRYRVYNGYNALGQRPYLFPNGAAWFGSGWFRESASGSLPGSGVGHTHGSSAYDYEIFRVLELRARVFLHPRLEVTAILPWIQNDSRIQGSTVTVAGLGDMTLLAGYHLIVPKDSASIKQRLIVGVGMKLPSGNYYAADDDGLRIDNLLQPGSGMTDYLAYAAYSANYQRWVGGITAQVKTSTNNYYQEKYAPGYTGNLFLGRQFKVGSQWMVVPQAQGYYEYSEGTLLFGEETGEHSFNAILGGFGVDVLWRNMQFTASAQLPLTQQTTEEHPQQAGRLVLGLTWNIAQTGYLFGGKSN